MAYTDDYRNPDDPGYLPPRTGGVTGQTTATVDQPQQPAQPRPTREQIRDMWMGKGNATIDDVRNFANQYGGNFLSDNGTVRWDFGNGKVEDLDMLIGARSGAGPHQVGWTGTGMGADSGAGGNGWQISGAPAAGAPAAAGAGAMDPNGTGAMARQALLKLLALDPNNVSINDPNLQPVATTYRNEQDRVRQARRDAAAERLATQGLQSSGALDQEINSGFEDMGRNTAGFEAQLVAQELAKRREQLLAAAQLGISDVNSAEGRALQKQLADIDAQLRRYGYDLQDKQFGQDLGYRIGAHNADLEQQAMLALLANGGA